MSLHCIPPAPLLTVPLQILAFLQIQRFANMNKSKCKWLLPNVFCDKRSENFQCLNDEKWVNHRVLCYFLFTGSPMQSEHSSSRICVCVRVCVHAWMFVCLIICRCARGKAEPPAASHHSNQQLLIYSTQRCHLHSAHLFVVAATTMFKPYFLLGAFSFFSPDSFLLSRCCP